MELNEANQIINSAKATMRMDGYSITPSLETLGALVLLNVNTINASILKLATSPQRTTACVFFRLIELESNKPPLIYDTETLLFLHKTIHADFKKDCGELRKINISKNGASCIDHKLLQASLKTVLTQMKTTETNKLVLKTDFAARLAHFMRELLILSPFTSDSGLVCRLFFELYAKHNGFNLDYYKSGYKEFSSAETIALTTDDIQPLFKCLVKSLTYKRFVPINKAIDTKADSQTEKLSAAKPIITNDPQSHAFNRRRLIIERSNRTQSAATSSMEASGRTQAEASPRTFERPKTTTPPPTPDRVRATASTLNKTTNTESQQKTELPRNNESIIATVRARSMHSRLPPITEISATFDRKTVNTQPRTNRYSTPEFTEVTKAEIITPDKSEFPMTYASQKTLVIEESNIISNSSDSNDFTVIPEIKKPTPLRCSIVDKLRRTINKV